MATKFYNGFLRDNIFSCDFILNDNNCKNIYGSVRSACSSYRMLQVGVTFQLRKSHVDINQSFQTETRLSNRFGEKPGHKYSIKLDIFILFKGLYYGKIIERNTAFLTVDVMPCWSVLKPSCFVEQERWTDHVWRCLMMCEPRMSGLDLWCFVWTLWSDCRCLSSRMFDSSHVISWTNSGSSGKKGHFFVFWKIHWTHFQIITNLTSVN